MNLLLCYRLETEIYHLLNIIFCTTNFEVTDFVSINFELQT